MGIDVIKNDIEEKLKLLEYGVQKNTRAALNEGADLFMKELDSATPKDTGNLESDLTKTGIKNDGGKNYIEVGYGKQFGWYAHFTNSGTLGGRIKAQRYIDKTQAKMREPVLNAMLMHLKSGLPK